LDKARRKGKIIEEKFKESLQKNLDKGYTNPNSVLTPNPETKYHLPHLREGRKLSLESQRIKEGICKYCGENWD